MIEGSSVLVDSDFWLGLYLPGDGNATKANALYPLLKQHGMILTVSNLIVGEVSTIISHRIGQNAARQYLQKIRTGSLDIIHVSEELDAKGIDHFTAQNDRGTSYVDCTNVAIMKAYKFPYICAFDKVYHQSYGLTNVAYLEEKVA